MNWLIALRMRGHYKSQTRLLSRIVGIVALCCSAHAVADPLEPFTGYDDAAWTDTQTTLLADSDLSFVVGKGAEELPLDADGKLAIILWDERGDDNRRSTNHEVGSRSVINLTVVRK